MKKLILTILILAGLSTSAQAYTKKEYCLAIGEMGMTVVEVRDNMHYQLPSTCSKVRA